MLKTLGLIIAIGVAVVLNIAVCLVGLALLCIGLWMLWSGLRRLIFPARDTPIRMNQTLLRDAPHFHRFQKSHTAEPVLSVAALPDKPGLTSTSRDKTLRVWDGEWNDETTAPLPFHPGPLVVGDHGDNGLRVAVGALKSSRSDEHTPQILVWEPMASSPDLLPRFAFVLPGLRVVHALAWDDAAEFLRVFAGVFDPSLPAVPNAGSDEPNAFQLLQWDLRETNGSGRTSTPDVLPLPRELDRLSPWDFANGKAFALSANGLFLACRTEYAAPQGTGGFGVGVWDVEAGAWRHRFGGREAQPHDLLAVSRTGDTVYSTRQDEPGRDYRNGGPEWYDGLYVWDARAALPEGQKEAQPNPGLSGSRNMAFSHDETRMANPIGAPGVVEIYDMQTKTRLQTVARPAPQGSNADPWGHTVWCCAFADSDRELVTGHADGQLWWWGVLPNDEKRVNENQ